MLELGACGVHGLEGSMWWSLGDARRASPVGSRPGIIWGSFRTEAGRNIIHGSDSVESAKEEVSLWSKPEEQIDTQS